MTLTFIEWRERAPYREGRDSRATPDGGFYVNIPACTECVRGAVKLKVLIPDDRGVEAAALSKKEKNNV